MDQEQAPGLVGPDLQSGGSSHWARKPVLAWSVSGGWPGRVSFVVLHGEIAFLSVKSLRSEDQRFVRADERTDEGKVL